jgi:hypothetical protein
VPETPIPVSLSDPLQHIQQFRPGFGRMPLLERIVLGHQLLPPRFRVIGCRIEELIIFDISSAHGRHFSSKQGDHLHELPKPQIRIQTAEICESVDKSVSCLGVHCAQRYRPDAQ